MKMEQFLEHLTHLMLMLSYKFPLKFLISMKKSFKDFSNSIHSELIRTQVLPSFSLIKDKLFGLIHIL